MTKGYAQIVEDEWFEPPLRGFSHQCCDCGLVHTTDYQVVDKNANIVTNVRVRFKVRVDRRKTAASRRKLKFQGDRE